LKESSAFLSCAESYYVKTKQIFNGISTRQETTHSTEPRIDNIENIVKRRIMPPTLPTEKATI